MNRFLLILLMLLGFTGTAFAACPGTLQLKDNAGVVANAKYSDDGSGNCLPNIYFGTQNVTPTDCSGTITAGGTAQNIFTGGAAVHGFMVANIDTSAGSGEPLWISFTGAAVAGAVASYPLASPSANTFANLSSFTTPLGLGLNTSPSIIAATTGHKFSCTRW